MKKQYTHKLTVTIAGPLAAHLRTLQATGLYGRSPQDAARRLIADAIERRIASGIIRLTA
jgi:hypothetical protein